MFGLFKKKLLSPSLHWYSFCNRQMCPICIWIAKEDKIKQKFWNIKKPKYK